jgi:ribosome maturation factor RimP
VEQRLISLCEPLLEAQGFELVELRWLEGKKSVLRIFVDRIEGAEGISIEECAEASRLIDPALDAEEVLGGAYTLEVSSPGVERALWLPRHFHRFVGHRVCVVPKSAEDGAARLSGFLTEADAEGFGMDCDGKPVRLRYDEVAKANLEFRFEDWSR